TFAIGQEYSRDFKAGRCVRDFCGRRRSAGKFPIEVESLAGFGSVLLVLLGWLFLVAFRAFVFDYRWTDRIFTLSVILLLGINCRLMLPNRTQPGNHQP